MRSPSLKIALLALGLLAPRSMPAQSTPAWPDGVPAQPTAAVTDGAGMLSAGAVGQLDTALARQWQAGHFQLAVLTLASLQDRDIEDLSIQVARAWGLGGKKESNGVLLLVAAKEHKMRIEVGSRLEGELPDVICHRIIMDVMAPRLRQGDADGAILAGAAAITAVLDPQDPLAAQNPEPQDQGGDDSAGKALAAGGLLGILGWLLGQPLLWLLLVWVLISVLRRGGPGGFGGGGFGGFGGGGFGGGGFGGGGGGGGGFSGGGGGFSGGGSSGGW